MIRRVLKSVLQWPGRFVIVALIAVIRLYQMTLGPLLGPVCRFEPSCSRYMIGSLEKYGFIRGLAKGFAGSLAAIPGIRVDMTHLDWLIQSGRAVVFEIRRLDRTRCRLVSTYSAGGSRGTSRYPPVESCRIWLSQIQCRRAGIETRCYVTGIAHVSFRRLASGPSDPRNPRLTRRMSWKHGTTRTFSRLRSCARKRTGAQHEKRIQHELLSRTSSHVPTPCPAVRDCN